MLPQRWVDTDFWPENKHNLPLLPGSPVNKIIFELVLRGQGSTVPAHPAGSGDHIPTL